jgi:hypothetical protein
MQKKFQFLVKFCDGKKLWRLLDAEPLSKLTFLLSKTFVDADGAHPTLSFLNKREWKTRKENEVEAGFRTAASILD